MDSVNIVSISTKLIPATISGTNSISSTGQHFITLSQVKILSEIFQSIGVGVGAFLGGLGGLLVFNDFVDKTKKKRILKTLRRKYPRANLNNSFRLTHHPNATGWIFLLDNHTMKRHWIRDTETLRDLGFSGGDAINVTLTEFDKYSEDEEIFTG